MASNYMIRTISNPKTQFPRVIVEPQKIQFINYSLEKTNVARVCLRNESGRLLHFMIIPPNKSYFSVKCKKNTLQIGENVELFVYFDAQKEKAAIQDIFCIDFDKHIDKLYVPIYCKWKTANQNKRSSGYFFEKENVASDKIGTKTFENHFRQRTQTVLFRTRNSIAIKRNTKINPIVYDVESNGQNRLIFVFKNRFSNIQEYVKQKYVKNEIFLGQKIICEEKRLTIINFNDCMMKIAIEKLKEESINRFEVCYSEIGPVIQTIPGLVVKWNKQRNQSRITYEKGLKKVQQEVRKFITNLRFQKIHQNIEEYRRFQQKNQIKKLTEKKKTEEYFQNFQKKREKHKFFSNYELNFQKTSILPTPIQIEYDSQFFKKQHVFQLNLRIGFDNWVTLKPLLVHDHEQMGYRKKDPLNQWLSYPILQKQSKKGAKEQYTYRNCNQIDIDINALIQISQESIHWRFQPNETHLIDKTYNRYLYNGAFNLQDLFAPQLQDIENIVIPQNESSSILNGIKCFQQNVEPYYQNPSQSMLIKNLLQNSNPKTTYEIIGSLDREDKYAPKENEGQKNNLMIQNIIRLTARNHFVNGKINDTIEIIPINLIKRERKVHQKLLEYLGNYKLKKMSEPISKVDSFNKFMKCQKNKILL